MFVYKYIYIFHYILYVAQVLTIYCTLKLSVPPAARQTPISSLETTPAAPWEDPLARDSSAEFQARPPSCWADRLSL